MLTQNQINRLEVAGLHPIPNKQKTGNFLVEDITIKSHRVRYSLTPYGYARRYQKVGSHYPMPLMLNHDWRPAPNGMDGLVDFVIKRANKYRRRLAK